MKIPRFRLSRAAWIVAALLLAAGGYYVARYHAWAAYRDWTITRMNGMARESLAAGDTRGALLTVRKVLRKRPSDLEALKLGVDATRREGTAEVVTFQRRLSQVERTLPNRIELIRLAVQHQMPGPALEAVAAVGAEARNSVEFHRLAADAYRLGRRNIAARYHLLSALALEPGDAEARLALAAIELEEGPPGDWRARVEQLALEPATTTAARILLLQHALAAGDEASARELSARLRTRSDLTLAQELHLLDGLRRTDPRAAEERLRAIQQRVSAAPVEAVRVMTWLAEHDRAADVIAWHPLLSEEARQSDPVKLALALAMERQGAWSELIEFAAGTRWAAADAMRLALLARAYRMTGRERSAEETWKLALVAGSRDLNLALQLLRTVERWKWTAERQDVLWKVFNLLPGSRTVREELIAHEFKAGNTVNLNKIYARILEVEPEDPEARNNFAYTSLLLGANVGRAMRLARELHEAHPENFSYLTTYTLALHRTGHPEQALELLRRHRESGLAVSALLHEAIYAAAAGDFARAGRLLPELSATRMLPEERQLFSGAAELVAKHLPGKPGESAGLLASASPQSGWMEWLPSRAPKAPEALRIADTLYRERRPDALRSHLERAPWPEAEHLRNALAAHVAREEGREDRFQASWRQALTFAGSPAQLAELETLARHWQWEDERFEAMERRFARQAGDPELLAELLAGYRSRQRTAEMARALWLHVDATNATGPAAAWCVYYSLLCNMNVSRAQALAHQLHRANPRDENHQLAYAFALWHQDRALEALSMLPEQDRMNRVTGMSSSLVRAAVLASLRRKAEAKNTLELFQRGVALREEIFLADAIAKRIEEGGEAIVSVTGENGRL